MRKVYSSLQKCVRKGFGAFIFGSGLMTVLFVSASLSLSSCAKVEVLNEPAAADIVATGSTAAGQTFTGAIEHFGGESKGNSESQVSGTVTKTVLGTSGENVDKVLWETGDEVSINGTVYTVPSDYAGQIKA